MPVIMDQRAYWTSWEASVLWPPLTQRDVRDAITAAGLEPAGRRPGVGRGRPPLVYDAGSLCALLSLFP